MRNISRTLQVGVFLLFWSFLVSLCAVPELSAQEGYLDLSSWNFSAHPRALLNGTWEMWWAKLLSPSDIKEVGPGTPVLMPQFWNTLPHPYPVLGAATFRLEIQLPPSYQSWVLRVPNIHCAYTLYINGQKTLQMGNPTQNPQKYQDALRPRLVPFTTNTNSVSLVLKVVNETDMYGGFRRPFILGPEQPLLASFDLQHSLSIAISGALLSLGLLQLFVFFLQPNKWSHLWLSLFSFCITWRGLSTGDRLMTEIFPQVPFLVWSRLEYLAVFLGVIFVSLYLRSLYRSIWPNKIVLPFLVYTGIFAILNMVLPLEMFAYLFPFYEFPLLGVVVIFFVVPLIGARRKHRGSWIVMSGILILALGTVNDLMYLENLISTGYILDKLLLIFMLFQSFLLSRQLADDYHIIDRQVKDLLAVGKLKDEFFARVSHELRTPLHGMLGITDMLEKESTGSMTATQKYHVALLNQVSQRLLAMVSRILDFSDLKRKQVPIKLTALPLKATIDFLMPYFQQKDDVSVLNKVPEDFPPVAGDLVLVQHLIFLLVENALTHTEVGTIHIEAIQQPSQAIIHVKDTGKGIPKSQQVQMFETFHQVEEAETRTNSGLGLGLAICQEIILQLKGSISLTSEEGRGTTVTFTLPWPSPELTLSSQEENSSDSGQVPNQKKKKLPVGSWVQNFALSRKILPPPPPPSETEKSQTSKTLLLVDDDPINIILLKNFLKPTGYKLLEARNGFEALTLINSHEIDLIILDIMMPGMSGYEVCQKVRENFDLSSLPIILLTAKSSHEDIQRGLSCGASAYMTKPFRQEEILDRVKSHLGVTEEV